MPALSPSRPLPHPSTAAALGLAASLAACVAEEPPAENPCPDGQVLDDRDRCLPEACGSTPWGDLESTADTVHVAPWTAGIPDGSRDRPYGDLGQAMEAARNSATRIVFDAGVYPQIPVVSSWLAGVEFVGRCRDGVVFEGHSQVEVDLVEISPSLQVSGEGAPFTIEVSSVTLRGGFRGVMVSGSATLVLRDALVEDALDSGVFAAEDTNLELHDVAVRSVTDAGGTGRGFGIWGAIGSTMVMRDVLVEDTTENGIRVNGVGATADLEDVVVRGTRPNAEGVYTYGVAVYRGALLTARRLTIEDTGGIGLTVARVNADRPFPHAEIEDLEVRGSRSNNRPGTGIGVYVTGGTLDIDGFVIEDNQSAGLYVRNRAHVAATDGRASRNGFAGVAVQGRGSIDLEGAVLEGSVGSPKAGGGVGLFVNAEGVSDTAEAVLRDVTLSGHRSAAIYAMDGAAVRATDVSMSDSGNGPHVPGGVFGRRIDPSAVVLERPTFTDLRGDAVLLDDAGIAWSDATFENIEGELLYVQGCDDDTPASEVDGDVDASCRESTRNTEPRLVFSFELDEPDVQD